MSAKKTNYEHYTFTTVVTGIVLFVFALTQLNQEVFNWKFACFAVFNIFITSRLSLRLPLSRTPSVLTFSDSMIFLTFLVYGGYAAIMIAGLEMFAGCLFKKRVIHLTWLAIFYNVGVTVVSTTLTYCLFSLFGYISHLNFENLDAGGLISILGILALSQFLFSSIFTAVLYAFKTRQKVWQSWKNECYSISLTQIIGASIAGAIYKLNHLENILPISITLIVLGVFYYTYRRSNKDLETSVAKTEQIERERREQAEKHVEELTAKLEIEENLNQEIQQKTDEFEYAASHDSLTDLFNRFYLIERLNMIFEVKLHESDQYYILFLDLKSFKDINDSLGHSTGDKVLKLISKRLLSAVNDEDTVARIGGDEFAIILNNLASVEEAEKVAKHIFDKLSSPFSVDKKRAFTEPRIGIAPLDSTYTKPEEILRDADIAMHYAKDKEINIAVFNTEIRDRFLDKLSLESELRSALKKNELEMYYQPLFRFQDGQILGFEALIRWNHPRRGFVSPVEFIPIAESSGLIIPITDWILETTTQQLADWQKISPFYQDLIISVNISGKHLFQGGLIERVVEVLELSKISSDCLKLEITESVMMEHAEQTISILTKLKELGVQLSIDDFGTGYSSLSYLHRLPFDTLKIDRSFVKTLGSYGENSEILQTIISLAKNLRMSTIPEGVETESQAKFLRNMNCDYAQGYLFSKPLPRQEMEALLHQNPVWFPESLLEKSNEVEVAIEDFSDRLRPF